MQEKCIFAKTHLENSDFVRTFADMPEYDIALELARLHILTGADFVRQLTGHNYVKKSGMSPVPRLIIIGVTEPLMHLKNCEQGN